MIEVPIKPWKAVSTGILDQFYHGVLEPGNLVFEWIEYSKAMVLVGEAGEWMTSRGEDRRFYDRENECGLTFKDSSNALLFKLIFL